VEATPQVIVLTVGAAEERAEVAELDALERRLGPARADRACVLGRDPVDLDRVELVEPFAAEQRQRGDVVIGKAEVGQQQRAAWLPWQRRERAGDPLVGFGVEAGQVERGGQRVEQRGIGGPNRRPQRRVSFGAARR
jgi:hypothetical protein